MHLTRPNRRPRFWPAGARPPAAAAIDGDVTYTHVATGSDHTVLQVQLLLKSDGTAVACGNKNLGQPLSALDGDVTYTQVAADSDHSVLQVRIPLKSDGTADTCGSNLRISITINSPASAYTPAPASAPAKTTAHHAPASATPDSAPAPASAQARSSAQPYWIHRLITSPAQPAPDHSFSPDAQPNLPHTTHNPITSNTDQIAPDVFFTQVTAQHTLIADTLRARLRDPPTHLYPPPPPPVFTSALQPSPESPDVLTSPFCVCPSVLTSLSRPPGLHLPPQPMFYPSTHHHTAQDDEENSSTALDEDNGKLDDGQHSIEIHNDDSDDDNYDHIQQITNDNQTHNIHGHDNSQQQHHITKLHRRRTHNFQITHYDDTPPHNGSDIDDNATDDEYQDSNSEEPFSWNAHVEELRRVNTDMKLVLCEHLEQLIGDEGPQKYDEYILQMIEFGLNINEINTFLRSEQFYRHFQIRQDNIHLLQ